ncbi:MAG: glutamate dehydrogenase [Flavobacteriaceae bacterium]|nr:glutamate dehydrogenase [Flavobacteriaceae bacterium]
MLNFKRLFAFFLIFFGLQFGHAQLGFAHEIGVVFGPVEFRSDFGSRNDTKNNFSNSGIGIGIVHYLNLSYRRSSNCCSTDGYFNDHFKLRTEFSWNRTKLQHYGEWVGSDSVTENANKLRAHTGEANNYNIGMEWEYFPFSISAFSAYDFSFAPFISLGAHYTIFNPKAATTYGDQNIFNANNFYSEWDAGSINAEGGTTWSVVASIGTRFKLSTLSDLMVNFRWQYYGNDLIDGLDHQLDSNKSKDWLLWLNFGYIYYLN